MTTKTRKCDNCGNPYPTKLVKVFVFQKRICPKCNKEMFSDNLNRVHECRKCKLTVKFDDDMALGSMGVAIKGSSRDGNVMRKMSIRGFEVTKTLIPKKRYCARCLKVASIIKGMMEREAKKAGVKEMSPREASETIKREVLKKLKEEHKKQVEERNRNAKEESIKQHSKDGKRVRITKNDKPVLLTTPFNTVMPKEKTRTIQDAQKEDEK